MPFYVICRLTDAVPMLIMKVKTFCWLGSQFTVTELHEVHQNSTGEFSLRKAGKALPVFPQIAARAPRGTKPFRRAVKTRAFVYK